MEAPDLDQTIWRYLTFQKFESLLKQRALWMCRLRDLQDSFEGTLPNKTRSAMVAEHKKWKNTFPEPELQNQFASMADRNVSDGRDILVVNCWFSAPHESERMWEEYASTSEGIAIRSTLPRLENSILVKQEFSSIGKVKYVDFSNHDMGTYPGHQAGERALLKQSMYSHEREVRVITHNWVCPGCLNPDGTPPTPSQLKGPGMSDPNRKGLFLQVNLDVLLKGVVTAPRAKPSFYERVKEICQVHRVRCPVEFSSLRGKR